MLEANRRQFLIGLISAAAIDGIGILKQGSAFTGEMGRGISVTKWDWTVARELLIADARKSLPEGVIFDIRLSLPMDYGRSYKMGWYTSEEVRRSPLINLSDPSFEPDGYYLFGRYENHAPH